MLLKLMKLLVGLESDDPAWSQATPSGHSVMHTRPEKIHHPDFDAQRGAHLTTQAAVIQHIQAQAGPAYEIASISLAAVRYLNRLCLITGIPGTGKTTLNKQIMKSMASLFPQLKIEAAAGRYPGKGDLRWAVIDPTNSYLPFLYQILPPDIPILRASPQDADGWAWDIARDIVSDTLNQAFQKGLFPDALFAKANDPFWYHKAREISEGTVQLFHDRKSDWTFPDLVRAIRYPQFLVPMLSQSPRTRHLAMHDLVGRLGQSVISTSSSVINQMTAAAAMWSKAKKKFSLRDYLNSRSVLHFAFTPDLANSLAGIANAMTYILIMFAIDRDEEFNHTVMFLDESKYLADITGLDDLAARGRNAGLGGTVTGQSIVGLQAKWGDLRARELLDLLCSWFTLTSGYETALHFSRLVGEMEGYLKSYGTSESTGGSTTESYSSSWSSQGSSSTRGASWTSQWNKSTSENVQLTKRDAVLTSEITHLPMPTPEYPFVHGFAMLTGTGAFEFKTPLLTPLQGLPRAPFRRMPTRLNADQVLQPFTKDDLARLNLEMTADLLKAYELTWSNGGTTP